MLADDTLDNPLKIFVGNLAFSVSPEALRDLFLPFGAVQGINIRKDPKTNAPRGFAFVTFESEDAASKALAGRQGCQLDGRLLTIAPACQRGGSKLRGKQGEKWKTAPPPRSKMSNKKLATGTKMRSWDQWAGPQSI